MSFEAINKRLNLYSCNILDLSVGEFISIENELNGKPMETLTIFRNIENNLVLNKEHRFFEHYKELAETYLPLNADDREQFKSICPNSIKNFINVLEVSY